MRVITTILACLYLSACAGLPTRPPLGQVLVITGAVIVAGAVAEHHQANHLVDTPNGTTAPNDPTRGAEPSCVGPPITASEEHQRRQGAIRGLACTPRSARREPRRAAVD
jgi:hypothetical protein